MKIHLSAAALGIFTQENASNSSVDPLICDLEDSAEACAARTFQDCATTPGLIIQSN